MNRKQFIALVEAHRDALRRFLVAMCSGNSDLADDIAQDTFMKAYIALDSFKDEKKFKAWIFKIAYNSFLNAFNRSKTYVAMEEIKDSEVANEDTASPFKYEELYKALDCLSPSEKTSILLYYMEGYSTKEISQITEDSEASVRKQLSRGRIHLKNILLDQNQ